MKRLLSFLFTLICSAGCWARVDFKSTQPLVIPVDTVTPKLTSQDVARVVPLDLRQGDGEGIVFSRIADRSVSLWLNSSVMKETSMGRIAEETQQKLKADVVVPASTPMGTQHHFSFKIEAFQALAKVEYTGWLRAMVNYDAKAAATQILFKEKVFLDKDLVLSHRASKEQVFSTIGLAWTW